jgi:hypothetical protein
MSVRAKFAVLSIKEIKWSPKANSQFEVGLAAQYDPTIPEDQRFLEATPSASVTMTINNPEALAYFKLGGQFYADFTAIEEPAVTA